MARLTVAKQKVEHPDCRSGVSGFNSRRHCQCGRSSVVELVVADHHVASSNLAVRSLWNELVRGKTTVRSIWMAVERTPWASNVPQRPAPSMGPSGGSGARLRASFSRVRIPPVPPQLMAGTVLGMGTCVDSVAPGENQDAVASAFPCRPSCEGRQPPGRRSTWVRADCHAGSSSTAPLQLANSRSTASSSLRVRAGELNARFYAITRRERFPLRRRGRTFSPASPASRERRQVATPPDCRSGPQGSQVRVLPLPPACVGTRGIPSDRRLGQSHAICPCVVVTAGNPQVDRWRGIHAC